VSIIRLFGWIIGGAIALVGAYFMYLTLTDGGNIAETDFLIGFVWTIVGGMFVIFAELLDSHVFRSAAR
ncbi:MAG: hypothetical protein ACLFMX_07890, partial [Halobacteriales archaeon]